MSEGARVSGEIQGKYIFSENQARIS